MRYTDRDCYAALLRLVHSQRSNGYDVGIVLDCAKSYWPALARLAEALSVPLCDHVDEARDRYILDHAPSCYGGGVRPMIMPKGGTGHVTPHWWGPSAGLGPGAVPRKTFCHIVNAVGAVLDPDFHVKVDDKDLRKLEADRQELLAAAVDCLECPPGQFTGDMDRCLDRLRALVREIEPEALPQ